MERFAFNLPEIQTGIKGFAGRLKAIKEREGLSMYQNDLWLIFIIYDLCFTMIYLM